MTTKGCACCCRKLLCSAWVDGCVEWSSSGFPLTSPSPLASHFLATSAAFMPLPAIISPSSEPTDVSRRAAVSAVDDVVRKINESSDLESHVPEHFVKVIQMKKVRA